MLTLDGLRVAIRKLTILRWVSLDVPDGTIVGLVGRNGAGKTTTLRTIMGLMPVAAGTVVLHGRDLTRTPAHRRAGLGIGYMPEDRRLIPTLSVEDNLLLPAWATNVRDAARRLACIYEHTPELRPLANRPAAHLSGGQQKLVALARALIVGTTLLLLDEPFEGLAPALGERLGAVLQAVAGDGGPGVLLVESERHYVGRLARRVYTIERGEITETK